MPVLQENIRERALSLYAAASSLLYALTNFPDKREHRIGVYFYALPRILFGGAPALLSLSLLGNSLVSP